MRYGLSAAARRSCCGVVTSALAIGYAGTKLAGIADRLADRTGVGEIIAGAVFVGASTSLPGAITSIVTAAQGYPALAIRNALGGLAAQTTSWQSPPSPTDAPTWSMPRRRHAGRERYVVAGMGFESAIVLVLDAASLLLVFS